MILGRVNSRREAIIQIAIFGKNKQYRSVRGLIDTGFTGFLTLPSALIKELGLVWYMNEKGTLGDGSKHSFNVYEASVIWDGKVVPIDVNDSEAEPLIGMGLLEGFELKIQSIPGGLVTITSL